MNKRQKSKLIGVGVNLDQINGIAEKIQKKIRVPIKLNDFTKISYFPQKNGQIKTAPWKDQNTKFATIYGAAGEENIPEPKLKIMSDHYKPDTRKTFSELGNADPILSSGFDRVKDTIFEAGFDLVLEPAAVISTPQQIQEQKEKNLQLQQTMTVAEPNYQLALQKLSTWKDDIHLLQVMRDHYVVEFIQGKSGDLITPGIQSLQEGQMPIRVDVITAEELGDPIVDIGLTRKIVGVTLNLADEEKELARIDELVYTTRGKKGLRKEDAFQGTSGLEALLVISRILQRIYNFDFSEAVTAGYIVRILFKIRSEGDESDQEAEIQKFLNNFLKSGKIAFAMTDAVEEIKDVQPKVDWALLDGIEKKLADLELSIIGVPKSMMNREHGLTRDIATIEAIQYVRFVIRPAENKLASEYENQLINPLFAHLVGKPLNEIPWRIKIKRKVPEGGDIDSIYAQDKNLSQTKAEEISSESLAQNGARSTFGATGPNQLKKLSFKFSEIMGAAGEERELEFDEPSSFVGTCTYTPDLQSMEVQLNGTTYNYCNVPQRIFEQFKEASSKGQFYNREIKGVYSC